jgi:hypothetical protein
MNVTLTNDLRDFVRKKVESGQFPSEDAVLGVRQSLDQKVGLSFCPPSNGLAVWISGFL